MAEWCLDHNTGGQGVKGEKGKRGNGKRLESGKDLTGWGAIECIR
jgi:hypothetical protein